MGAFSAAYSSAYDGPEDVPVYNPSRLPANFEDIERIYDYLPVDPIPE